MGIFLSFSFLNKHFNLVAKQDIIQLSIYLASNRYISGTNWTVKCVFSGHVSLSVFRGTIQMSHIKMYEKSGT